VPAVISHYRHQYELDAVTSTDPGQEYEEVLYEADAPVAFVTLNRPERRNAFNDNMYEGMLGALHRALLDDDVKVVVIRGAGLGFSAGHDLTSPKQEGEEPEESPPIPPGLQPTVADYWNIERRRCHKYEDLVSYPKILIAQVHGFCIGAGEFLQASCDFTIASDDAQFGTRGFGRMTTGIALAESSWPGGSQKARAGELLAELTGKAAAEHGLINSSFPLEELDAGVHEFAMGIADLPADSVAMTKSWYAHMMDAAGMGLANRSHYMGHVSIQWTRFREGETNFYKLRRDSGLSGYIQKRGENATPDQLATAD
jgi:enoyl-CoA hydratase